MHPDGDPPRRGEDHLARILDAWAATLPPAPGGLARRAVDRALREGARRAPRWRNVLVGATAPLGAIAIIGVLAVVAVIALRAPHAAILSAIGGPVAPGGAPGGSARPPSEVPSASPAVSPSGTAIALPVSVGSDLFQLTYEQEARMIWAIATDVTMSSARLVRFDPGTRTFQSWSLPPPEAHGDGGPEIRIVPDGSDGVWLVDAHRISYFDLSTQSLKTEVLPTRITSASNLPITGNWNTGATGHDGELLVSRWAVPWVTRFDRNLEEVGRIDLPATYAGAAVDLASTSDGTIIVVSEVFGPQDAGTFEAISPSGQIHVGHVLGFSLRQLGPDVLSTGSSDGTQLIHADGSVTQLTIGPDAPTVATVDPRGGLTVVLGGPSAFALAHVVEGAVVGSRDLPTGCLRLGGGLGGPLRSNAPTPCGRVLAGDLTDLVDDSAGTTWYLLDHQLYGVVL